MSIREWTIGLLAHRSNTVLAELLQQLRDWIADVLRRPQPVPVPVRVRTERPGMR
jgi:hypothetical protein